MNFSLRFEIPLKMASTISHQALSPAKPHNPDTLDLSASYQGGDRRMHDGAVSSRQYAGY